MPRKKQPPDLSEAEIWELIDASRKLEATNDLILARAKNAVIGSVRLTCHEAAARLGLAPATLYRRLSRARKRGTIHVTDAPVSGVWLLSWDCWQIVAASAGPRGRRLRGAK